MIKFPRKILPWRARPASSNNDSDINELLSTSFSEIFPDDSKHMAKLDENTIHTMNTIEGESEDDSSHFGGNYLQKRLSFEEENNDDNSILIEDDSDRSLHFRDVFPEYPQDDNELLKQQEESFAQVVCELDIRHLRKEQRKKVIKAFFGPMKYLVKPVMGQIPRLSNPIHFPAVNYRSKRRRRRVSFGDVPIFIVEDSEELPLDDYFTGAESTWYNDSEYESMKKEVLRTMEQIVRCHKKNRKFIENEHQTARGLELVTKDMILERKLYKVMSRHVVFDEQEEQRLKRTNDPERIRDLYAEASRRARDTALASGWKDQEIVHGIHE